MLWIGVASMVKDLVSVLDENAKLVLDKLAEDVTFIVLAGGKATRMGSIPKPVYPILGLTPLGNTLNEILDHFKNANLTVALRPPHADAIDNWLKETYNGKMKDGKINRVKFGDKCTKAYAIQHIAEQTAKKGYVVVLHADVFYPHELLKDVAKCFVNYVKDERNEDAGLIYLARLECPSPCPSIKTKITKSSYTNLGQELLAPKKIRYVTGLNSDKRTYRNRYHPIISIFNAKKLLEINDVPVDESPEERGGTTYIYKKLMNEKRYRLRAERSDYVIADINNREAFETRFNKIGRAHV